MNSLIFIKLVKDIYIVVVFIAISIQSFKSIHNKMFYPVVTFKRLSHFKPKRFCNLFYVIYCIYILTLAFPLFAPMASLRIK